MAIKHQINLNGIRGLLSHYEISTLPDDYEMYKPMFHDATERRQKAEPKKIVKIIRFIKKILCLKKATI